MITKEAVRKRSQIGKADVAADCLEARGRRRAHLLEARGDRRAGFLDDLGSSAVASAASRPSHSWVGAETTCGEPLLLAESRAARRPRPAHPRRASSTSSSSMSSSSTSLALLVLVALVGLIVPGPSSCSSSRGSCGCSSSWSSRLLIVPGLLRVVLAELVADVELLRLVRALALVPSVRSRPCSGAHAAIPGKLERIPRAPAGSCAGEEIETHSAGPWWPSPIGPNSTAGTPAARKETASEAPSRPTLITRSG